MVPAAAGSARVTSGSPPSAANVSALPRVRPEARCPLGEDLTNSARSGRAALTIAAPSLLAVRGEAFVKGVARTTVGR